MSLGVEYNDQMSDWINNLMKSKDQQLLEEAYLKVQESSEKDYFQDALVNPSLYELILYPIKDEDWEGNAVTATEASIYTADNRIKLGSKTYEEDSIHVDELDHLIAAFKKHNPEGLVDNR
jgi:hypothetical protein